MDPKRREKQTWIIVIIFLVIIFLILYYVYSKNQTNLVNFDTLPSYRIQHVKSGKWLVVKNAPRAISTPPRTNQPALDPYIPLLCFSENANSAFGVWNIDIAPKDSNGTQRWRLQSNLSKRYCNKINLGFIGQEPTYICNGAIKIKGSIPGPQFVKLVPSGNQNTSKTTGSKGTPVPTSFKMFVQQENGKYLPCVKKESFSNNGSPNIMILGKEGQEADLFRLRFPITPLTAN